MLRSRDNASPGAYVNIYEILFIKLSSIIAPFRSFYNRRRSKHGNIWLNCWLGAFKDGVSLSKKQHVARIKFISFYLRHPEKLTEFISISQINLI